MIVNLKGPRYGGVFLLHEVKVFAKIHCMALTVGTSIYAAYNSPTATGIGTPNDHTCPFRLSWKYCRSPSAQAVFATRFRLAGLGVETDSVGTANWHIGDPPYGPAQMAANLRGVDMSNLCAGHIMPADFLAFDLIIGMDDANLRGIEALRTSGNPTPVRLFTDFAPDTGATEVPDPYYTRDFEGALDLIKIASDGLIKSLQ